jgi:hypothetical protein
VVGGAFRMREGRGGGERRKPLPRNECEGGVVVRLMFRVREGAGVVVRGENPFLATNAREGW